jgi:diguanylate cyclase (GGDEF)-like protein
MDVIDKIKHGRTDFKKIIFCKDEIGTFTEHLFDIKEQRDKDFENLRQLSITDPLTNTKNRRAFFEISEKFFKLARRKELDLCIILIDIDHFKKVNDTYGHIIGDEILKFLVKQLDKELRDSDILARYGGEEFIVLLPDTDLDGGVKTAEKIRKAIEEETYKGDVEVAITISLGVAQLQNEKIINDLIRKSDEALYKAKNNGRNRVESY